ncbi:MAG: tyrosine-type recombinase/integrase, partial [Candidatus Pacearchaeota archaeon]|nr:tyrosine-type recombinase/integrase [Candidatus Pacearchaeota archaeon]
VKVRWHRHEWTEDNPNRLTADELRRFLAVVPARRYPLVALLAFTGMRVGEAMGLKWSDIDFDKGYLQIERTNYRGRVQTPKTKKSPPWQFIF